MAQTRALLTADDLLRLPDDGKRYELIAGELIEKAPASPDHGFTTGTLYGPMYVFLRSSNLGGGLLVGDVGFRLHHDPDTVRAPDIAYLSAEKLAAVRGRPGFPDLAPDLAVEVVSPGDTAAEVHAKAQQWLESGTRLVWVVFPATRSVLIYEPGGQARWLRGDDVIHGDPVLPGFSISIAEIF